MIKQFHILSLLVYACCCSNSWAELGPAVPDYPAKQVAKNVYVIHGPLGVPSPENQGFMNNPAFVVSATGVVVIDPGSSLQTGQMVLRQIRKVTDQPVQAVLNTHKHGDHWLGNHAFIQVYPEIKIYAHPRMIEEIEQGGGDQWQSLIMDLTQGASAGTEVIVPNQYANQGDELDIAGIRVRCHYEAKAHSDTDLMFEFPEHGVIFLGDNAMADRFGQMFDATFKGNIAALDLALELDTKVHVPGHGPTGGPEVTEIYRQYLNRIYQQVAGYYDEGMSDFEMKPLIVKQLAEYSTWEGFDEQIGKHINRAYLEVEADMF